MPSDTDGLRRALAPVHRRHAGIIHARRKRTGHFWQGRFGCVAMDETHLAGRDDGLTALAPVRERYPDFANFLSEEPDADMIERLRGAETIGRPLGDRKFFDAAERETRRVQAGQAWAEAACRRGLSALSP